MRACRRRASATWPPCAPTAARTSSRAASPCTAIACGRRSTPSRRPPRAAAPGQRPRPPAGQPARRPLRGGLGRAVVGARRRRRRDPRGRRRARGGRGRAGGQVRAVHDRRAARRGDRDRDRALEWVVGAVESSALRSRRCAALTAAPREESERWPGRGRRPAGRTSVVPLYRWDDRRSRRARESNSVLPRRVEDRRSAMPVHPDQRLRATDGAGAGTPSPRCGS